MKAQTAITLLGELLEASLMVGDNPTDNTGCSYEGTKFQLRAYYWGDNELTADLPNFVWRDFNADWYKHINRGFDQSRDLSSLEVIEMLNECTEEIKNVLEMRQMMRNPAKITSGT